MTSVSGHLLTYEFSSHFRGWKNCDPIQLFDAPITKNCPEDYQKIKQSLEKEVNESRRYRDFYLIFNMHRILDTRLYWSYYLDRLR